MFVFDNTACGSWSENDVFKVVTQTIANNAIPTTTNNPLVALKASGRNLVQQTRNQVIIIIQDIVKYM